MTIVSEGYTNVFKAATSHVVCTVNCQGHMGRGVALYLRKAVPGLYDAYRAKVARGEQTVNTLWVYPGTPNILIFPTKDRTWEPSKIEWIKDNLQYLREHYQDLGITSLALTPLGCKNGELAWPEVRALIYAALDDIPLPVTLCLGVKKMDEIEPLDDGTEHLNVYSKGKTWLGKALSNMSAYGFTHPTYGEFASLEGYWYWLATGKCHEALRSLTGYKAKEVGKSFPLVEYREFKQDFLDGMKLRLVQNKVLGDGVRESRLPFLHYFEYGGKVVDRTEKHRWQLDFYDEWRTNTVVTEKPVILIAGSRTATEYDAFEAGVFGALKKWNFEACYPYDITILSGLAWKGPDDLAITLCRKNGFLLQGIPALWKLQGKPAGMIRNGVMAQKATHALIFWDGVSPGTKEMIKLVKGKIPLYLWIHGVADPQWYPV